MEKQFKNLALELYLKGEKVQAVPEETELELRLANLGQSGLAGLELWLGRENWRGGIALPAGGILLLPYRVQDTAGRLVFTVKDGQGNTLASAEVEVYPQKISGSELEWIKYTRLPHLLAQLDAPNVIDLSYTDEPSGNTFPYVSLDFTAEKLRQFSRHLLDEGLLEALGQRLDYRVIEKPRRDEGVFRGNVRWNPTVQDWLNSPAETGLTHHRVEAPVDYATRPNLLLVSWLKELIFENRKLAWRVETTRQASVQLQKAVGEFRGYADGFERFLALYKPLQFGWPGNFSPRDPAEWEAIERSCRESFNPAYERLAELFTKYKRRYISLPEDAAEEAGNQPLSVIYEWWAACEIASALGLAFVDAEQGRQSGLFQARDVQLFYNQAMPGGWYSADRTASARPDLRLDIASTATAFFDVKYRAATNDPTRANPEDMYRMLAYMSDFSVATGTIIFPGPPTARPKLRLLESHTDFSQPVRRLGELALRPPADPNEVEAWAAELRESLAFVQINNS